MEKENVFQQDDKSNKIGKIIELIHSSGRAGAKQDLRFCDLCPTQVRPINLECQCTKRLMLRAQRSDQGSMSEITNLFRASRSRA